MNGSSKINSYLMPAKCTVSYPSVGFVVPGDSTYNQLQIKLIMIFEAYPPYARCYLLIRQFKRFSLGNDD